jgi:hypothetical protein
MGLVAGAILSFWMFYAYQAGLLQSQSRIVTQLNPSFYVSSDSGIKFLINSITTRLTSAIGVYNLPLIIVGVLALLRRRSSSDWMLVLWILSVSLILIFTLPDHRYFMPTFPAMAIAIGTWLKSNPEKIDRVLLLSLFYLTGALYLFVDWSRTAQLWKKTD